MIEEFKNGDLVVFKEHQTPMSSDNNRNFYKKYKNKILEITGKGYSKNNLVEVSYFEKSILIFKSRLEHATEKIVYKRGDFVVFRTWQYPFINQYEKEIYHKYKDKILEVSKEIILTNFRKKLEIFHNGQYIFISYSRLKPAPEKGEEHIMEKNITELKKNNKVNEKVSTSHQNLPDFYKTKHCSKCGSDYGCMCPREDEIFNCQHKHLELAENREIIKELNFFVEDNPKRNYICSDCKRVVFFARQAPEKIC